MKQPNEVNDAIAIACGFSPERLHSLTICVVADRWPVVKALYVPLDNGELTRILASLEAKEDIMHVEAGESSGQSDKAG